MTDVSPAGRSAQPGRLRERGGQHLRPLLRRAMTPQQLSRWQRDMTAGSTTNGETLGVVKTITRAG